jgi:hypothetical protein
VDLELMGANRIARFEVAWSEVEIQGLKKGVDEHS